MLEFVNLLFKDAVDTMCFVCLAVTFRPSRTILYNIFNVVFFTEVRKNCQKHFGLYDDGLLTYNKCCAIAVLFFVFGDVMLSIIAAISPSLYVAIDNRISSAAKLCVAAFVSFAPAIFLSRL